MKEFTLKDYIPEIVSIASANEVGASDAIEMFVVNLNTFGNHYKGAENLNMRELGQAWSKLSYKVRNKQRRDVLPLVAKKITLPTRKLSED